MPIVDITILIFILFWSFVGLFKGFVAELIALICWSSAIYFAANYFYIPADYIMTFINSAESVSARTCLNTPALERPMGVRMQSTITACFIVLFLSTD